MLRNLFIYPILCGIIYNNIRTYLESKRKFSELFNSLEIINIKIENINRFINRRKVMFKKSKPDNIHLNIDDCNYSSSEDENDVYFHDVN